MTIFEINKEIQRGEQILQKGYVQEALTIFDSILEKDPGNNLALNDKGVALNQLGRYDQAIEIFQKLLAKKAANPTVVFNLIANYMKSEQWWDAGKIFKEYGHVLAHEDFENIQRRLQAAQAGQKEPYSPASNTFDYAYIHETLMPMASKRLFFIMGVPKSGTTWVQHLLNGHPEISCSGEGDFNRIMNALKDMANNYNRHITGINKNIGIENYLTFQQKDLQYLFTTAIFLLFRHWPTNGNDRIIGSKNPIMIKSIEPYPSLFPQSKYIHIIRDGRDVVTSAWFNNLRGNKEDTLCRWPDFHCFVEFGMREWVADMTKARSFGKTYNERYLEVRYEDLHNNPNPILEKMLEFLGVDPSLESLGQCIQAGSFKSLSHGRERGQEDRNAFFRKGIIGDWKNHFAPEDEDLFMGYAGKLLEELGYSS
ncbi:MAG: sulfotransferase [Deltaproteobacteria bacterium]|nr:sulfotransferase [Deltaproteobacteria bacterium]